jgi:hypothetical protein
MTTTHPPPRGELTWIDPNDPEALDKIGAAELDTMLIARFDAEAQGRA